VVVVVVVPAAVLTVVVGLIAVEAEAAVEPVVVAVVVVVVRVVVVRGQDEPALRNPDAHPLALVEQTLARPPLLPGASHQVQVRFATHKSHGKSLQERIDGGAVVVPVSVGDAVGNVVQRHVHDSDVDERPGADSHSDMLVRPEHGAAACARVCAAKKKSTSVGQRNNKANIVCTDALARRFEFEFVHSKQKNRKIKNKNSK
jgi:hypothetical protein